MAAVAFVLVVAVGAVASAHVASARASAAADLAALAGAQRAVAAGTGGWTGAEPCGLAAEAARRNGGVLVRCVPAPDGSVTVRVRVDAAVGGATGDARAGPVAARSVRRPRAAARARGRP